MYKNILYEIYSTLKICFSCSVDSRNSLYVYVYFFYFARLFGVSISRRSERGWRCMYLRTYGVYIVPLTCLVSGFASCTAKKARVHGNLLFSTRRTCRQKFKDVYFMYSLAAPDIKFSRFSLDFPPRNTEMFQLIHKGVIFLLTPLKSHFSTVSRPKK